MEIYILIIFIWFVGWLCSCGFLDKHKDIVRKEGTSQEKIILHYASGKHQYVILFFAWPYYIGRFN